MNEESFALSNRSVRQVFDRAADTYDAAAVLQAEVGRRLLERLDYLRINPALVVDLGTGTGLALDALRDRYPSAHIVGIDISEGMLRRARKRGRWLRRPQVLAADARALPLADRSVDLLYANLLLPWCVQIDQVWAEISRVLRPGGAMLCTTLGPDTLMELRAATQALDSAAVHVHAFIDMHDIGDALIRHRIAEPVMDAEKLQLSYPSVEGLIRDLRQTGSGNIAAGRRHGLNRYLTAGSIARHYPGSDSAAGISATIEVVYGHGWASEESGQTTMGVETYVPVASLQRRKVDAYSVKKPL